MEMKKIDELDGWDFPEYLEVVLPLQCGPGRGASGTAVIDLGILVDKINEVVRKVNNEENEEILVEEIPGLEVIDGWPYNPGYITNILPTGAWKDKTCFILGGGPSLKDFDFNLIKDYPTIGVNKSFIKFPTDIMYAMDIRFYGMLVQPQTEEAQELRRYWLEYQGITVFLKRTPRQKFDPSVYYINQMDGRFRTDTKAKRFQKAFNRVNRGGIAEILPEDNSPISFDLEEGVIGGNNSGFGALMLAIALGATRIGLLGFDMKVQGEPGKEETHCHEGYSFQSGRTFQSKLDKFIGCFENYSVPIKEAGVIVVNLNPDSKLECFPFDTIDNFLRR